MPMNVGYEEMQNTWTVSGSQEEQKDAFDVSYKFREWFTIKFIKPRDNTPEWRWTTERNLYL